MNTNVPRDAFPSGALIADTVRIHRVGVLAWTLGGAAAMLFTGLTLVEEMRTFPGGPKALELSVLPGVQAFRLLRWPAEHLDTLGGYLTYHNIGFLAFFLALYGAMQGARSLRGSEERGSAEMILSTGWRPWAVIRDRSLGFAIGLAIITSGLAAATAISMAFGEQSDLVGSVVTMVGVGLCGLCGFGIGVLLAQLTPNSTVAAGLGAIALTGLYVVTNVQENVGALGWLAYASPFYYANKSRALVPGYGLDVGATAVLVLMAVALLAVSAWAFTRRDYGAPLWALRTRKQRTARAPRIQGTMRRTLTAYYLDRGKVGILAWTLTASAFAWLYMSLAPTFMDAFKSFSFVASITGGTATTAAETLYNTFTSELAIPILAAFAITQAAAWVAEYDQGRVEMYFTTGPSAMRIVIERMIALTIAMTVITAVAFAAIVVSSGIVDNHVDIAALARTGVCALLFGLAIAGVGVVTVAALRSSVAVVALAVYVGAAYVVTLVAPVFGWPEWTERASVFWAVGHPYLQWPTTGGIALLIGLALVGTVVGTTVMSRLPKAR